MNWFRGVGMWAVTLAWLAVGIGCTNAADNEEKPEEAETVVISLDQIAGLFRGGLRALEPELHIYRDTPEKMKRYSTPEGIEEIRRKRAQSLVLQIEQAVRELPHGRKAKPPPGFAVSGRDRQALPEVHRVLVEGEIPQNEFPVGSEVSIIFFTSLTSPAVIIDKIEQKGSVFEIHYLLKNRRLLDLHTKLMFIPCGKLKAGDYQVKMIRAVAREAREKKTDRFSMSPVEPGLEEHIICRPFSFVVVDKPDEKSNK